MKGKTLQNKTNETKRSAAADLLHAGDVRDARLLVDVLLGLLVLDEQLKRIVQLLLVDLELLCSTHTESEEKEEQTNACGVHEAGCCFTTFIRSIDGAQRW